MEIWPEHHQSEADHRGGGEMSENRRRNNPEDMKVSEMVAKIKEEVCDNICKYRNSKEYRGIYSQETLDEICEHECPLIKL